MTALNLFFGLLSGWFLAEALIWSRGQDTIFYLALAMLCFTLSHLLYHQVTSKSKKRTNHDPTHQRRHL